MTVKEMTDQNYNELISSSKTLIIDSWAEWCGPCKKSTPVFEQFAAANTNAEIVYAELDTKNNPNAAMALKIMSLPTFIVLVNGNVVKKWSGADIERLRKEISEYK